MRGCLAELEARPARARLAARDPRAARRARSCPLAAELGAEEVFAAADVSPFARRRDGAAGGRWRQPASRAAAACPAVRRRRPGADQDRCRHPIHRVHSIPPALAAEPRRPCARRPRSCHRCPSQLQIRASPELGSCPPSGAVRPGEAAAQTADARFRGDGVDGYVETPRRRRRGRDLAPLALPALRLRLGAGAREPAARDRRRRGRAAAALLARLLRARAAAPPRQRARPSSRSASAGGSSGRARCRCSRHGGRAAPAIRWSTPGCASWPAPADAQPRADGRRLVPGQGHGDRLALGRALVHAHAARRRRGQQQRQLAVDRVGRRRSTAAVAAHVQPDAAAAAVRPRRRLCASLRARAASVPDEYLRRALDDARRASARDRVRDRR